MSLPFFMLAAIFGLGGPELMIILVIILLMFGGSKLPQLARGLGDSVREFKKASKDIAEESKESTDKKAGSSDHGKN